MKKHGRFLDLSIFLFFPQSFDDEVQAEEEEDLRTPRLGMKREMIRSARRRNSTRKNPNQKLKGKEWPSPRLHAKMVVRMKGPRPLERAAMVEFMPLTWPMCCGGEARLTSRLRDGMMSTMPAERMAKN